MKTIPNFLVRVGIVLASSFFLHGQSTPSDPATSPTRGIIPTGSYTFSDIETINNANGNLLLKIPIVSLPPGRGGLTAGVSLVYNSKTYDTSTNNINSGCTGATVTQTLVAGGNGGWHYAIGYLLTGDFLPNHSTFQSPCTPSSCNVNVSRLSVSFPDGSSHLLVPRGQESIALSNNGYTPYTVTSSGAGLWNCDLNNDPSNQLQLTGVSPVPLYTVDGTHARVDAVNNQDYTISFLDGHKVNVNGAVETITDRNGNSITISSPAGSSSGSQSVIEDQFGRTITITYSDSFTTPDTITASGSGGAQLEWQVFNSAFCTANTYQTQTSPVTSSSSTIQFATFTGVTQIVLPSQAGSLSYNMGYGTAQSASCGTAAPNWGELHSLTLPSGAQTTYTFFYDNTSAASGGLFAGANVLQNTVGGKTLTYTATSEGAQTTVNEPWMYQFPATNGTATTNITAPDGGTTIETTDGLHGLSLSTKRPNGDITERIWNENRVTDGTQPVVSSLVITAQNPFIGSEFTSHIDGSGSPAITSVKQFGEDQDGNTLQVTEYGYINYSSIPRTSGSPTGPGSAPVLRTTSFTYFGPSAISGYLCNTNSGFYCDTNASRVLTSVQSKTVGGTGPARTEYCYDNATVTGNVTLEARWDSTKSSSSSPLSSCSNGSGSPTANAIGTNWGYDSFGNRTSQTDPMGHITTWTYGDITGNSGITSLYPTQTVLAAGTAISETTSAKYEIATGLPLTQTDANGVQANLTYDPFGRPASVTKAFASSSTTYSDTGLYTITTVAQDGSNNDVTVQRFDPLGRVRLTQTLESAAPGNLAANETVGILVERRYLYSGSNFYQLISNPYRATSDPTMGWSRTKLDQLGRPIELAHFNGGTAPAPWASNSSSTGAATTSYLANANTSSTAAAPADTTTVLDEASNAHVNSLDAAGRLIQVNEAGLYNTSYTYDVQNNLLGVNQSGLTRTFNYTSLSRLSSATNPETGPTTPITYTYDNNGNLMSRSDSRVATNFATYDALNRPTQKSYTGAATPTVQYCYDGNTATNGGSCSAFAPAAPAIGRLTSVSSSASTTNYTGFDLLGNVFSSLQTTGGSSYQFNYGYNLASALTSIAYPSGRQITYSHDGADRVSAVAGSFNSVATNYTSASTAISYAPHGAVSAMTFGNGLTESTAFNARLQPIGITAGSLLSLGYSFSNTQNNGNVLSQTIAGSGLSASVTQSYTYDGVNRLATFTESGGAPNQNYGYDAFGNRWISSGWVAANVTVQTPQSNNFTNNQWAVGSGVTYDGSGNQMAISAASRSFSYDAENRQTLATIAGFPTAYVYDGDGRRVQKIDCSQGASPCNGSTSGAVITTFVYDAQGHLVAEYGGTNSQSGTQYLTADHLGSTRMVTDASANPVERLDYAPFGEELTTGIDGRVAPSSTNQYPTGSPDAVSQKFTSKERDAESGNDYFSARYYASSMGRFMSPDWSAQAEPVPYSKLDDPQTLNLYSYVRNNPLSGVDPDGHYFVVGAQDQKFYQQALTDLYRRPGGRDLVNSLANSDRPVLLDRGSLDTANTGLAGVATALAVSGQPGVAGVHVTVGSDADLAAGAKMAPGQVSSDVTTGHELEHANDGITAGQNSLQAGAAAMAAGDAPSSPGAHNTVGGTAQSRSEGIMGQKTDMNKKDAGAAVQGILQSGQQQWQNNANKPAICSQNQGACH